MQEKEKIQAVGQSKAKVFTKDDVLHIQKQLEQRSGSRLDLHRPSPVEISLTCHNMRQYQCGFKYLFRKFNEDPEKEQYLLHTEFDSHHLECISEAFGQVKNKSDIISSPSFKRYTPEMEIEPEALLPQLLGLGEKNQIRNRSQNLERSLVEECLLLQTKHSSKFYTEEQVSPLKKELQFESKGLVSKSTEFHPELGYITKISFKCKFENNNCPYLATLTYTERRNAKNQNLVKLQKIHSQHANSCILDDEEVHFNFVTRKIDENFGFLIKIIRENSIDVKPKRVLELFAMQIEEEPDFIYKGIDNKNNRRAAKKYFDNSVAKARNTLK